MTDPALNTNESTITSFADFSLPEALLLGLKDMGYTKPTLVQQKTFDPVKQGRDIVLQSHTGSGKTTAFCLPILAKLQPELVKPQALVMVPTRELAKQVALECSRIGYHLGVKVAAIYGGASMDAQISTLKSGAHILIATPGRLKDLHSKNFIDVEHIKTAVLDEADEMLSMGFWDDVVYLLGLLPKTKQTLLFSATVPSAIENTISTLLNDPQSIQLSTDQVTAKSIHHVSHLESESELKQRNLLYALEYHNPKHAIVFCNTKDETELLERYLKRFGFKAKALNGDMSQSAREKVMHDIKEKNLDMIIATDIAARGIDINGLTHVFNYELPDNDEVYIHRTGRTGRAGATGTAISLIREKDTTQLAHLQQKFEIEVKNQPLPAASEILRMQAERLALLLTEEADKVEFSQYLPVAKSMLKRADNTEILAFLLRHFYNKPAEQVSFSTKAPKTQDKPKKEIKTTKPVGKLIPATKSPKAKATFKPAPPPEEFTKLYITLGRNDGFEDITQLVHHISMSTGVDMGNFTGMGQVRDSSSHVEVDTEIFEKVIQSMNGKTKSSGNEEAKSDDKPETIVCEITHFEKPSYKSNQMGRRKSF